MHHGQTTEGVKCALHQFERNRYFYGTLMTVRDFETEQRYGRGHRYLHKPSLHGWGVVCGLTVEPKGGPGNERKIVVHPGVALDCCGHEMVLAKDQEVDLSNFQGTIGEFERITPARLAEGLGMAPATLEPEITRLMTEGLVRRGPGGRLTLIES